MYVCTYIMHMLYPGKVFLLYSTLDSFKDKPSITTVISIRSENNLALLWLYVLLGISEHMLWIQSMPRVTCSYWGIVISWKCLVKPLLCMCNGCWVESILRPGGLKRILSHKWLTWYLPTFLFNDGLFTLMQIASFIVLASSLSSLPIML